MEDFMIAAEFEYRHRFWMIVLVYGVAYAFYNLDHRNILYSIVPWNQGVQKVARRGCASDRTRRVSKNRCSR
jgi:hypothetical protein